MKRKYLSSLIILSSAMLIGTAASCGSGSGSSGSAAAVSTEEKSAPAEAATESAAETVSGSASVSASAATESSKESASDYWYDNTKLELEKPGTFEMNPTKNNSDDASVLAVLNTTADVSVSTTEEGCEDGFIKTVITATHYCDYASLSEKEMVFLRVAPLDLYSGKFYEDLKPDDDYSLSTNVGTKDASAVHEFDITDGMGTYKISWYNEAEESDDRLVETIYVTHPKEYNGVGLFLGGAFESNEAMNEFGDYLQKLGGWTEMFAEDYAKWTTTPHIVDCRMNS